MVQVVREAESELPSSPTGFVLEIRSPDSAEFTGRPTPQVHTVSCNTRTDGCTEKLRSGPEAHFMFLSIQSLKGSTLVKAV